MDQVEPQKSGLGVKIAHVNEFFAATRREVDKLVWPTSDELRQATQRVIVGALALGIVIGLLDLLLQKVLIGFVATLGQ